MSASALSTPFPNNQLLASLPAENLARLKPLLQPVPMLLRDTLWNAGESIERVFFPVTG